MCFLVPLYSIGWISGFLLMKLIPASTCRRKSYPKPVLLSSYQENASFKSFSASGLAIMLYFTVCLQSFCKPLSTESLIQDFCDIFPTVHQLFFSPPRSVQQKMPLHLSYPRYLLPIEFIQVLIIQEYQLRLFFSWLYLLLILKKGTHPIYNFQIFTA